MGIRSFVVAAAALFASATAEAQVTIKLGTLAPSGSTWHNALKEMGQKWAAASGGKVKLVVFPGGTVGNEGDMVRKMRIGQLQAAALTTIGLHEITPEPQAVDIPLGVRSFEELDYVMEKLEPKLNKAVEAKGYVVLLWSDVGFVQFFSTRSIATPADMKGAKLFAWDGDPASVEAWRAAGFSPVVLSSTDVIPSLQTGLVDTIATAPLYALTARIYQKANKASSLRWAVLTGATVVKKEVWDQVPGEVKGKLLDISRASGKDIAGKVRKMNEEALDTMKKNGLAVVEVADLPAWEKAAENANKIVRGKVVPADTFDEVMRLAKDYRAKGAKK